MNQSTRTIQIVCPSCTEMFDTEIFDNDTIREVTELREQYRAVVQGYADNGNDTVRIHAQGILALFDQIDANIVRRAE